MFSSTSYSLWNFGPLHAALYENSKNSYIPQIAGVQGPAKPTQLVVTARVAWPWGGAGAGQRRQRRGGVLRPAVRARNRRVIPNLMMHTCLFKRKIRQGHDHSLSGLRIMQTITTANPTEPKKKRFTLPTGDANRINQQERQFPGMATATLHPDWGQFLNMRGSTGKWIFHKSMHSFDSIWYFQDWVKFQCGVWGHLKTANFLPFS